jgi:hypothetical protein
MTMRSDIEQDVLRIIEDDVTEVTAAIPTHIQRAQREIEELCVFRSQKTFHHLLDIQPLSPQPIALPADFIGFVQNPYFYPSTGRPVSLTELDSVSHLENEGTDEGFPRYFDLIYDAATSLYKINISPKSDGNGPIGAGGAYKVVVEYWKRFPTLTATTSTNFLTDNLDDALGWKAAAMVYAELRDPMANFWEQKAMVRIRKFVAAEKRNRLRSRNVQIYPSEPLGARNSQGTRRVIKATVPS